MNIIKYFFIQTGAGKVNVCANPVMIYPATASWKLSFARNLIQQPRQFNPVPTIIEYLKLFMMK